MNRSKALALADHFEAIAALLRSDDEDAAQLTAPPAPNRTPDQYGLLAAIAAINILENRGLDREEASTLCKQFDYDARGFGSLANRSLIDRIADRGGLRWVSALGLQWLEDQGWQRPNP
jgi:hypothetical protein